MIDAGADPNLRNRWNDTALITAVDRGYEDLVSVLAAHGANLDATRAYDHATALVLALRKGRDDIARILIEAGADVSLADDAGERPLTLATDPALRSLIQRHMAD
jgi:ankyrin repeat protein